MSLPELPTLLPPSATPDLNVLRAKSTEAHSDIFPETYPENSNTILGKYQIITLPIGSPLHETGGLLSSQRGRFIRQEKAMGWTPTEVTARGLLVAKLQLYLLKCTSGAYQNLLLEDYSPSEAVEIIDSYVDGRDATSSDHYNQRLDALIAERAKEHGKAVVANSQVSTKHDIEIRQTRLRTERLKFEWLSAKAIGRCLRQAIETPRAA